MIWHISNWARVFPLPNKEEKSHVLFPVFLNPFWVERIRWSIWMQAQGYVKGDMHKTVFVMYNNKQQQQQQLYFAP